MDEFCWDKGNFVTERNFRNIRYPSGVKLQYFYLLSSIM